MIFAFLLTGLPRSFHSLAMTGGRSSQIATIVHRGVNPNLVIASKAHRAAAWQSSKYDNCFFINWIAAVASAPSQ